MANEEHVAILNQGVEVWNQWRKESLGILPDLNRVDLSEADLRTVNFDHADLSGANLFRANLSGANLYRANLNVAKLNEANLIRAELSVANLSEADLTRANLCEANLEQTNLHMSYLLEANMTGANLYRANLSEAEHTGADWSRASLGRTIIGDVDLSQIKGLESVVHRRPSSIGIDTVYVSGGNIPESFLRGAGVPETFITFMKSLTSQAFDFYSCFISHSSKDQEFVQRLYADLQSSGVRCWYAPEDLKIGEPFVLGIDQGIRLHDKLLLVLSEQSVNSGWVQQEVLSALAKEQGKEPWVLFPIRLDDAVMDTTVPWANMIRQSRHIGDFTRWKDHDSYKTAFERLLRDLKGKSSA